jgi:hypothetical protein
MYFVPMKHFADSSWQCGATWPDAAQGKVRLTARGGYVGRGPRGAAIRRWLAPRDGIIRITGELSRPEGQVGTLRGRIVSTRQGELGVWTAAKPSSSTSVERLEVKSGDVLDFIVDAAPDAGFWWSPRVRIIEVPPGELGGLVNDWRADADFHGQPRPLSAWEKFAQVLLMTNEFAFDN